MTRREYLQSTGSVAFLGWGAFDSADDALEDEPELEYDGDAPVFPDHITETRDDTDELEEYAPKLVTTPEARSEMRGMYGWIAESEEFDVTAYYYWTRYNTQRSSLAYVGLDVDAIRVPFTDRELFGFDSHYLDHEPYISFVNDDGTVEQAVATAGHHYAMELDSDWGSFTEDRVSGRETHANLAVIRPWNHFMDAPRGEHGDFVFNYASFGSWLNEYETWYRNNRYERTADIAVMDPFRFYDDGEQAYRDHWWEADELDARVVRDIRLRRITDRDQLRIEDWDR
ncbi:hypothetical protein BB347_18420 (plasmid) [Natronorubrum daqingense]|uniref:Uncharacterized protein n=1 Tax=Natronorubrum daqingense TaxID=588898 RepID=A0A1P8RJH3_9EURY|nr:hypothetical protein BB347_18420 [Natronorubrum daqingense]